MQSITTTPTMLGSFFLSMLAISGSASTPQATVLCPGLPEQQYCDCSGDCTGFPEWCGCQEAQECCHMSSPVVLCPGQPRENYCDCTNDGDCTEQPDWCSCQQAEECCNGGVKADTFDDVMSPPKKLTAKIKDKKMKAVITLKQSDNLRKKNNAVWKVSFTKFDEDLCDGGELNWHIHHFEKQDGECGPETTGGHFDPFFLCGGASQNNGNGSCTKLRETVQQIPSNNVGANKPFVLQSVEDGYNVDCTPKNQFCCEVGDQSGKLGPLKALKQNGEVNTDVQTFKDKWMVDIDMVKERSIVLHCGSTRIACANFE